MTKLAQNIKDLRAERGYTLEELGKIVHTSKQNIARYENGTIPNIPHDKIVALAKAFGVTPGYLMGWEGNVEQETNNAAVLASTLDDSDLLAHIRLLQSMPEKCRTCVYEIAKILSRHSS